MTTGPIELTKENGVGWIRLNRPDAGNAINSRLSDELFSALSDCSADPDVTCIVLAANGKIFCAGGDLSEFADNLDAFPEAIKSLANSFHRCVALIDELEKPFITSIQGASAGAGLVLAASGDIALASDKASFLPAYLSLGLTPDGGTTWTLPRLMGVRRATEFLLTGKRMGADEAYQSCLVTRVVPHEELAAETAAAAKNLASGPTHARGRLRRLIRDGQTNTLAQHLKAEATSIAQMADTDFAQKAVSRALNKTSE